MNFLKIIILLFLNGDRISKLLESLKFSDTRKETFSLLPETHFAMIGVLESHCIRKSQSIVNNFITKHIDFQLKIMPLLKIIYT